MPREGKYAARTLLFPATRLALCNANSSAASVARPAGFQNAASPRPADAVAVCPMPTACAPTGNAKNSAPALWGRRWAQSWTGGMLDRTILPTVQPSNIRLKRPLLIHQHDVIVVPRGIDQPAPVPAAGV